jgi:oligoendopeptidase F
VAEAYEQTAWSLNDLFPASDSPEAEQAIQELKRQVKEFEEYRDQLSEGISVEAFHEILDQYERLARMHTRVLGFAHLLFAQDTQDQDAQTFLGQMQQLSADLQNQTLFFTLWWKGLGDEAADRLMRGVEAYTYWLEALRLHKPYTLSEPEEKIINIKDVNGPAALINLYNSLTNRYSFKIEVEGEEKELTRGELQVYYRHFEAELREAAYKELYRVYEADAPILGQIYQYRVRDWRSENVGLRGYAHPIAVRNLSNNIPDEIVDALLESCRTNAAIFHRFFKLKARWLGVERLRRYDLYAPVVKTDKTYPFSQAVELILDSFKDFDPRFVEKSIKVLAERHLDSEVRKGKRSGAFCASLEPDLTPWVLTNYQGKPDNVATLAHELGHAVHALLSNHLNALTWDPSLPLAETASTFAEMLLIDHLLEIDPEPEVQRDLLFKQIDDAYATVMRQGFFALFERTAHDLIQSGASVEQISEAYFDSLEGQFGDSMDLSEDFRFEWLAIPHFYHTPFYVYAYAFGQLLVFSLYKQYQEEGEGFKPRYINILSAGGSDAPLRILEKAGVDVHSPDFWQGGFDFIDEQLGKLEEIEIPEEG